MVRAVSGRCLAVVVVLSVISMGACKSRGEDAGGGSGVVGNTAGSDGARLALAPDVDASKITVTVLAAKPLPVAIERYTVATDEHFTLVRLVELAPENPLATRGQLRLLIAPGELPPNIAIDQLRAVGVGKHVAPEDLEVKAEGNTLVITIQHIAHVMVLAPLPGVTLIGTPAKIMVGTTRVMREDACKEWLTPTSPRIQALAKDPAKFSLGADGAITLGEKLASKPVDAEGELSKPDDVLARGGGDSANISIVLASLFLARGHAIGLGTGFVKLTRDGREHRGLWQWAMVVVEGKPYFVDAFDPAIPRLVPLGEAEERFQLRSGRYCFRTADGSPIDKSVWRTAPASSPSGVGSGTTIPVTIPR